MREPSQSACLYTSSLLLLQQAAENETGGRWAVHHGSQPVGAPALQRAAFGDGRGIHGDAAAAASLAAKFGAPEEVKSG